MKLSLGTVQFGLDYGVTNAQGRVSPECVGSILELAQESGISMLDTAIAYGESEQVLGEFDLSSFYVTSKIPSMQNEGKSIELLASESLKRLNIDALYGLMLHDESDVSAKGGEHIDALCQLRRQGIVQKIGVSFYSADKAMAAIESGKLDMIQVPANILDGRFESKGVFDAAKAYGVEVHVRSLFLQGLLAVNNTGRPQRFQNNPDLMRFDATCHKHNLSPIELSMMYLQHNKSVAFGVVGCTNREQFAQIVDAYNRVSSFGDIELVPITSSDDVLLNPSKW